MKPLDWASAMGTDLGSLKVIGAWWSEKESRSVGRVPVFTSPTRSACTMLWWASVLWGLSATCLVQMPPFTCAFGHTNLLQEGSVKMLGWFQTFLGSVFDSFDCFPYELRIVACVGRFRGLTTLLPIV